MQQHSRFVVDLLEEPVAEVYQNLVNFASRGCSYFQLAVRDRNYLDDQGKRAVEMLYPFLLSQIESSSWPGTMLYGTTATLLRYHMTSQAGALLLDLCDRLYGWCHPHLPEDLCFMRKDQSPWLASISHEQDAYFELSLLELEELKNGVQHLSLRLNAGHHDATNK